LNGFLMLAYTILTNLFFFHVLWCPCRIEGSFGKIIMQWHHAL
jgi:hypothetical protein